MEEKRTIRVYHQNPSRQLAREEAVLYLVTRELPARVVLDGVEAAQVETYEAASPEDQRIARQSYGHLTVAYGHVVHSAQVVEPEYRPPRQAWEPIAGLEVTLTPFDPEANVVTGGGDIALSMGGRPHTVDESQALLRIMAVAVGIASSAQTQLYTGHVITN